MSDRARRRGLRVKLPDLRTSTDAAGDPSRIVGHGYAAPPELRQAPDRPHGLSAPGPPPWNLSEAWNVPDDVPDDPGDQPRPLATLVSFHYLRAAVRRRWRFCAVLALLGMLLAVAYLVANPAPRTATTTLRLTHNADADPSVAMATDISLVTTRTVAERTIKNLGLTISPEDMMSSVKAVPTGSTEILQLTLSAPTDAEAVRRLDRFTKEYLSFRATQIFAQSDTLIKGYQDQINDLESQAQTLSKQIETLSAAASTAADQLSAAVTKQSQIDDKINTLEGTVQEQKLQQKAVVLSSRVIDPAAPALPHGGLRRTVLVLASGLIGGLAIGLGAVVLRAILSDRLWLRIEVASALNASVLLSVRSISPLPRLIRIVGWLPWLRAAQTRRAIDQGRIARSIERGVPESGRRHCVAVVCLNNSDEMRFGVAAAAVDLQKQGRMATIVDVTEAGKVARAVARCAGASVDKAPAVLRPRAVPSLAGSPPQIDSVDWGDVTLANGKNRVTLVLADFDPAIGVDHLTAWTDTVIVAVTAGKSSVELVRTAGDLIRSVGLHLHGAVLLRAARHDMSSGIGTSVGDGGGEMSQPATSRPDSSVGRSS
jgi:capsular polysaccharide biosynthesis protein